MRSLLFASALCVLTGIGAAGAATLESLQWDYRVIVVFAPTNDAGRDAVARLKRTPGIEERDIGWFVVTPAATRSNLSTPIARTTLTAIRATDGFESVLVGKDGGVKSRQSDRLDIDAFFDAIDRMPMRQQEIQQQRDR